MALNLNTVIQEFLNNFNYLDKKGKRSGFILFENSKLTEDNIVNAGEFKKALASLIQVSQDEKHSLSEADKMTKFIDCINKAVQRVKKSRETFAPVYHYSHITPGTGTSSKYAPTAGDPSGVTYDYKTPYKPGKFEVELHKGLNASIKLITSEETRLRSKEIEQLRKELCTIDWEIQNQPKPKKIIFNYDSFAP